jgi:hypothetical protein
LGLTLINLDAGFPIDFEAVEYPPVYSTDKGAAFCGDSLELLSKLPDESINLVVTSPPFALQRKKEYGNKNQSEYIDWLADFARLVYQKLKSDGSFVLDLGGLMKKENQSEVSTTLEFLFVSVMK